MKTQYIKSVLFAVLVHIGLTSAWAAPSSIPTRLTIEESVRAALEHNPVLKARIENRNLMAHGLRQARGEFLPNLELVGRTGSQQYNSDSRRSVRVENDFESSSTASLTLTQTVWDGCLTRARVSRETSRLASSGFRVEDSAEVLALDAVTQYLQVMRQQKQLEIAKRYVTSHETLIATLEERQRSGVGSIVDLYQARNRLARTRASLKNAEGNLAAAEAAFFRITGLAPGVLASFDAMDAILPASLSDALRIAEEKSPRIAALYTDLEAAGHNVRISKSRYMPTLTAELSSAYKDTVDSGRYTVDNSAMLVLRWNLFNGGSDRAGVLAASAQRAQTSFESRNQHDILLEEVAVAWNQRSASRGEAEAYTESVRFSEETLSVYRDQFNIGQRRLLDVLDLENEVFQARSNLIAARANEQIASAKLLALQGNLIETLGMTPVMDRILASSVH